MDRIVFQEVPNEVSLLFQITGCQIRCKGCHSNELWNKKFGMELSNDYIINRFEEYSGLITCALFFGGEWYEDDLIEKLKLAKSYGLKTCLYSGELKVNSSIIEHLDYLKLGPWIEQLGGLNNVNTNQVFLDVKTNENLNYLFRPKQNYTHQFIHTTHNTEVQNAEIN